MSISESKKLFTQAIAGKRQCEQVQKVLGKWSRMAADRQKDETLPLPIRDRLADCQKISDEALSLVKSSCDCDQFHVYVCFDEIKVAQGVACVWESNKENTIYLSKIVTCPWNISASNQLQKEHSVKGSGTTLLKKIQLDAINSKKNLRLNSLPSAKEFYLKLGFKPETQVENPQDSILMTFCTQR